MKVSWKPSEDAGRSAIEYIINTTTMDMDYINSTSIMHRVTSVPISGIPQYSSGTVSVWAKNHATMSKPVVLMFRMVNIVTNGRYCTYQGNLETLVDVLNLGCPVNAYYLFHLMLK